MEAWRGEMSDVYEGRLERENIGVCGEDAEWGIVFDASDRRGWCAW
jgi:hypothetical protein